MDSKDLITAMTENAQSVGTYVKKITCVADAIEYAIDLNIKKKYKTLACPGLAQKEQDMMLNLCNDANMKLLNPFLRDKASLLDTALTWANYGIADTGTLMLTSDSEEIRISTMLAKIHIAMLPVSKIRPDTASIKTKLDEILKQDLPSYTAFITGASRTADIERVLAIGVHGPIELHLLLLED